MRLRKIKEISSLIRQKLMKNEDAKLENRVYKRILEERSLGKIRQERRRQLNLKYDAVTMTAAERGWQE